jgi:hypothetical protein
MVVQKIKKEFLTVILVGLVIAISGCTMPQFFPSEKPETTPAGTQGLRIESFGPDLDFLVTNQPFSIEAVIKNVGGATAKNIKGTPYLLAWKDYKGEKSCAASLNPPNPELNREGGTCTLKWSVKSPEANILEPETYRAGVRVSYDYSTITTANIYAISDKRRIALAERGEPIPKVKLVQNSNAPVHVDVKVEDVIIIPSSGTRNVPVTLVVKNVGNGNVKYDESTYHYVVTRVDPEVNIAGVSISDDSDCTDGVYLRGGEEGSCSFTLSVSSTTQDEIIIPIKITTDYTYEITKEAVITLNPRLE